MSVDLVVANPLGSAAQTVMDQNGNSSSLYLSAAPPPVAGGSAGMVAIYGPGGLNATAALSLATSPSSKPNVQMLATDLGASDASLSFNLLPAGNQTTSYNTVLRLNPDGSVAVPSMPNLPASDTTDLVVDSYGNISPQTSSVRFKENVMPLADDFHKILALEPKAFNYRDSRQRTIGLIAEDVDSANLEGLVTYDGDGRPLSVQYKLIPLYLLELVKEQQRRLDEQERTMAELRAAVAADRTH